MENRWSEQQAAEFLARYGPEHGEALALRTYSSRLLGAETGLVLHGGGNTSLKDTVSNIFGTRVEALFVKASGSDLATIEPDGHVAVDLAYLRRLQEASNLTDEALVNELRTHVFDHRAPTPSIETPVHAVVPGRFVDHTHADAILALTNQPQGEELIREALGTAVLLLPYRLPGFLLSKDVAAACAADPQARAMVWMSHGIVTWGDSARESYDLMIELVSRAEEYLIRHARQQRGGSHTAIDTAIERLARVAPLARGLLAAPTGDPDRPVRRVVLRPLVSRAVLDFLDSEGAKALAVSPPLTTDHLIRTGVLPAWVNEPDFENEARLRVQLKDEIHRYATAYHEYVHRHAARMPAGIRAFDPTPRVVLLPGLGALCAGRDARAARIAADITAQTLAAKARIAAMGSSYTGLEEHHLFDMEYRTLQHAKLHDPAEPRLAGQVVLITGAAGAIGSGIAERLLEEGAHVALTDLEGPNLDTLGDELGTRFPDQVTRVPLDVTDPASVTGGFARVCQAWGGVDGIVINAGLALLSSLEEMDLERFRRLEQVNLEGTMLLLREAASHFRRQGTGGDIVLVSTKNVFAPGARFGAYSATKAASHQLARIASLELADLGVRVNMVSPDAVFAHGTRRSGLWEEVGPDRMRARGLDPDGLEEYYRTRNLLKVRVRADHVANAVLFFLSRQTPTTGATLPVDGGLPDATPR